MRALVIAVAGCFLAGIILYTVGKTSALFAAINTRFAIENVLPDELIPGKAALESGNKTWSRLASASARLLRARNISISQEASTVIAKKNVMGYAVAGIRDGTVREPKSSRPLLIGAYAATREVETGTDNFDGVLLLNKAKQLKAFAEEQEYSTQYGFIINMGMKSGKNRFFVIDLSAMTIINKGVVAHGRGADRITLDKRYSNQKGSNCTSLGIYKVGGYYTGTFGPSYKLYGLQNSNSNAFDRAIVLHAMNCIPNSEIDFPIFQSEGCPAISPDFLKELGPLIKQSDKPVLLWIFDSNQENQTL